MKIKDTVGVDVSKQLLDIRIYSTNQHLNHQNKLKEFPAMIRNILKATPCDINELLICFEYTGVYSVKLATYLSEQGIPFVMVPGLEVKRSLGITRGKSDRIDAKTLAKYAYLRREELEPTQLPNGELVKLKDYLTLRNRLIKQRSGLQQVVAEYREYANMKKGDLFFQSQNRLIKQLNKEIKRIEQALKELIEADATLKEHFDLATSVKGVGLILGAYLLVSTQCFSRFKTWRQYASYCGTAPFPYQSGSSIKGRDKVHPFANKTMKVLLHHAAMAARQHDPELKRYFEKQVEKGKNKMSVLNAIRNKIIARVFATVNRGTPYVQLNKFAA